MAKTKKSKKIEYKGKLNPETGEITWDSPSKSVTKATDPPPPPPKLPG